MYYLNGGKLSKDELKKIVDNANIDKKLGSDFNQKFSETEYDQDVLTLDIRYNCDFKVLDNLILI